MARSSSPPTSVTLPPSQPPPLVPDHPAPDTDESTNTLALLLPHLSLFAPQILLLLRDHYALFGPIAHWAPVKGFGRVILVYEHDEDAMRAKSEGDRLVLDVNIPATPSPGEDDLLRGDNGGLAASSSPRSGGGEAEQQQQQPGSEAERTYFSERRKRRRSAGPANGLVLRLHYLPPTPLVYDPNEHLLKPPEHAKNFLISPPGSPPEGWEPIVEDGPNTSTLADDLQRALERIALNGRRRGSREVILEEGGVRVEVEDTDEGKGRAEGDGGEERDKGDVEEVVDHEGTWAMPQQNLGGLGGLGGKVKILPTARPPI